MGDAREDGEAAPRRSCQQDREVSMSGGWKSRSLAALVQERERVQEGPTDRRLQGLFLIVPVKTNNRNPNRCFNEIFVLNLSDPRPHVDPDHGVSGSVG